MLLDASPFRFCIRYNRWLGDDCVLASRPWQVPVPLVMYGDLRFGDKISTNPKTFPSIVVKQ